MRSPDLVIAGREIGQLPEDLRALLRPHRVVLITGFAGAGKTTLCSEIHTLGLAWWVAEDPSIRTAHASRLDRIRRARTVAEGAHPRMPCAVVVDAACCSPPRIEFFISRLPLSTAVVWLDVETTTRYRRLMSRSAERRNAAR